MLFRSIAVQKFAHRCDARSTEDLRYELEELVCRMIDVEYYKEQLQEHFHIKDYYQNTDLFEIVKQRMKQSLELKE